MPNAADRDALRTRELAALSKHYSAGVHIVLPSLWGLLVVAACIALVRDVRWLELLTIPVVLVLSNTTEWRLHKDVLHKRSRFLPALYDRHTPVHHMIYVHDDMRIRSWREAKFILIPAWAGMALFAGLLPLAAALWLLVSPNVACMFEATCMFYVVSYELLHMSYHLPGDSVVGRNPVLRRLARHHSIHHDPRLMQKWNMNVSVPLWDWVRGTKVGEEALAPRPSGNVGGPETPVGSASAAG